MKSLEFSGGTAAKKVDFELKNDKMEKEYPRRKYL